MEFTINWRGARLATLMVAGFLFGLAVGAKTLPLVSVFVFGMALGYCAGAMTEWVREGA